MRRLRHPGRPPGTRKRGQWPEKLGPEKNDAPPRPRDPRTQEFTMFVTPAYAQGLGGLGDSQTIMQFLPLILIFVVFYFLLIRPQQKKAKEHKTMLGNLRRGDRVVLGGGIIGTVAKVSGDDEVLVDIAENTRVKVVRSTVSTVLARTEPAKEAKDDAAEADNKDKRKKLPAAGGK
jgi:preprotein translocase subunit YajC